MFDAEKRYTQEEASEKVASKKGPPTKSFVPESPSMPKLEDTPATPKSPVATNHDNSITSDPSEATTTISDELTVISQKEPVTPESPVEEAATVESVAVEVEAITISQPEPEAAATEETIQVESVSPTASIIPEIIEPDAALNTSATVLNQSDVLRVDATEVYQILDSIRQTTNLSHKLSCVALQVILSELENIYSTRILHLLEPIAIHLTDGLLQSPDEFIEHTHDSLRLKAIFAKLSDCKNDSEQRTWMLHEDEEYIKRFLTELNDILKNADKKISTFELSCDQYQSIINLIQYYQMETRWTIRELLLDSFKSLCFVDLAAIDVMLTSVLPLELVQDMQSNAANVERLRMLAHLFTLIFAMGQKMPVNQRGMFANSFTSVVYIY